ncbi:MAG: YifB family Mg chelatase-like AAA ATPase [Chloroflexi bacterium]|jgi:magnesium chelatase family protein|nr:YifB family Mg chelatase-like AAA ATPase [Chloroflexota bacterium]
MLATVLAATLHGLAGKPVRVEVDVAPGLPGFTIVGLADAALREARERVRGAVRNSGFAYPPRRITVNLAPADLPKAGSGLDLGIAIGVLLGSEQARCSGRWALLGELSLGGEVRPVPGMLPMVAALARRGVPRVVVPAEGLAEARLVPGIQALGAATLIDAVEHLREGRRGRLRRAPGERVEAGDGPAVGGDRDGRSAADAAGVAVARADVPDLAEVRGQAEARRALEIALAGGHALLLVGPPGTGKTLLARTIPGLLPALDDDEALRATVIASVAGLPVSGLVRQRPCRAPHHTLSYAAMVGGGGGRLAPGEITLATDGVLFLDELPEFDRGTLEALRQPLEDGLVAISRVGRAVVFPASFQLIAAMNPCPCGWNGDPTGRCTCRPGIPERYRARVSGPLLDRIDLWLELPRVAPGELIGGPEPEASAAVAARIAAARRVQLARAGRRLNARLSGRALRAAAGLDRQGSARAVALAERAGLSARATERLLRVARTIADLAGAERVSAAHLEESARYRLPHRAPASLRAG